MRAAIYETFGGPIEVRTVDDPTPGFGEALVAVQAVGLCRSDLHGWRGTDPDIVCPHVGGHEFVGRVVAVGPGGTRWTLGDRIVAPFVCGCGACEHCVAGQHQVCRHQEQPGFTRWGAFAGLTTIPSADHNAVRVPDDVADEVAALVGCRVSTAYRGVVERGRLAAGEILAVHGCGGVGLAAIAMGRAIGAEVVALDIDPIALELARTMGADHLLDASDKGAGDTSTNDAIQEVVGGAHVSIDCLGTAATAAASIRSLRPLGRHVQIGLFPTASAELPISVVIRNELEILGVHGLSPSRFEEVFALITSGALDLSPMVARRIALDDLPQAMVAMEGFSAPGVSVVTSGLEG